MTATATVLEFVDRINRRDPDALAALMTSDHLFVDSLGRSVRGRQAMQEGWRSYFALCPEYRVACEVLFADGDRVAIFGTAGGTVAGGEAAPGGNAWCVPAAWRAVVDRGRVSEWHVYADNEPVRAILAAAERLP